MQNSGYELYEQDPTNNQRGVSIPSAGKSSDRLDEVSLLTMQYRTAIGSYSEFLDSGGIFIIELELESFMIGQRFRLMVVWHCFALHAHRWISIYLLRLNGKPKTGKKVPNFVSMLIMTLIWHSLLYRPQLAVDGNMKLVRLIMKRPEGDVSLSDGELFMVKHAPYKEHLAHAPPRQPVSSHTQNYSYL
jgi:hypothetical protein